MRGHFSSEFSLVVTPYSRAPKRAKQLSMATVPLCFEFFGVVLMSYRVNFHVVRSALQYSPYKVLRHNIDIKVIEVCARVIARGSCIT